MNSSGNNGKSSGALPSLRSAIGSRSLRVDDHWNRRDWCSFPPIRIPWGMIAPHDEQAKRNHAGQDLARLESRGGVSSEEALAILDDREWTPMDPNEAHDELTRRVREYSENSDYGDKDSSLIREKKNEP